MREGKVFRNESRKLLPGFCNLMHNGFWKYRQLGRKITGSQRRETNANHFNPCCDYAGKKKQTITAKTQPLNKELLGSLCTKEMSAAMTASFIQVLLSGTQILDHLRNSWLPDKTHLISLSTQANHLETNLLAKMSHLVCTHPDTLAL